MPAPHISTNFQDELDPRFQRIFDNTYNALPDMLPTLYNFTPTNGRNDMRWSQTGASEDLTDFTGSIIYSSQNQGFDTTLTPE